jgi:hypothetical protein
MISQRYGHVEQNTDYMHAAANQMGVTRMPLCRRAPV